MVNMVNCVVLKREAEGLEKPPHPGSLGERIYKHVSKEGWEQWLMFLQMVINENQLATGDPNSIELIERYMVGFLFGEGEMGEISAAAQIHGIGQGCGM
uniref:Fe-S cluster biosynthesis and repair protein YggX n=1 Tax=Candidatus Kentrum eta TaxID=2126337 RepID=A0A450VDG2_9GAMM|nr:MAG: Fe-S cluster biosynthesis and repair protein YggX [Candidatus Kentron sp. H]VFJ97398.1 MAG: Fe-S cluster biosynthesis and repair protein YggX [Candidatus Kentron sp. H]VFK02797.1 MAG: Fe-S cluster biosynthesis and repair protein YggX [Candidatus Kentron sp. H]